MFDFLKRATKKLLLGTEIASRQTDPYFYAAMQLLPNPDPILRKMGKSQEVYDAIMADAHVIGEIRTIRANLLNYEWRLQPASESSTDMQALELAKTVFAKRPAPGMGWPDTFWTMYEAVLRGYRVHEVVWQQQNGLLMPDKVIDRPNKRFVFGTANELRLLTRSNIIEGEAAPDYKFLLSRHMPSYENPYGVAILSSCFWPYTFKHNGFRWFSRFCEKYGIPWAVGKYPSGTSQQTIKELADNLAQMVEDAVAAIPDAGTVELIESGNSSGNLPQERLIALCNSEMSKALTSQTLATEIQGQGSRAAAETHRGREQDNGYADRIIIEDTMNAFLAWVTELNLANSQPARFEFYEESEARQEWVNVFKETREFINIPAEFAHERLQIPMPKAGEAILPKSTASAPIAQFAAPDIEQNTQPSPVPIYARQLAELADPIFEQFAQQIQSKLGTANDLESAKTIISQMYDELKADKLVQAQADAYVLAQLAGRYDVLAEVENDG